MLIVLFYRYLGGWGNMGESWTLLGGDSLLQPSRQWFTMQCSDELDKEIGMKI